MANLQIICRQSISCAYSDVTWRPCFITIKNSESIKLVGIMIIISWMRKMFFKYYFSLFSSQPFFRLVDLKVQFPCLWHIDWFLCEFPLFISRRLSNSTLFHISFFGSFFFFLGNVISAASLVTFISLSQSGEEGFRSFHPLWQKNAARKFLYLGETIYNNLVLLDFCYIPFWFLSLSVCKQNLNQYLLHDKVYS